MTIQTATEQTHTQSRTPTSASALTLDGTDFVVPSSARALLIRACIPGGGPAPNTQKIETLLIC